MLNSTVGNPCRGVNEEPKEPTPGWWPSPKIPVDIYKEQFLIWGWGVRTLCAIAVSWGDCCPVWLCVLRSFSVTAGRRASFIATLLVLLLQNAAWVWKDKLWLKTFLRNEAKWAQVLKSRLSSLQGRGGKSSGSGGRRPKIGTWWLMFLSKLIGVSLFLWRLWPFVSILNWKAYKDIMCGYSWLWLCH